MGVTGKKRSREHSLSRAGAEHSRDAGSYPGSAHRSPKAGNASRQDQAAGSRQLKQQHGANASGNSLHARAGKSLSKEKNQGASAKTSQQKHVPLRKAGTRPDGGRAAPVLSTMTATLQAMASADCSLPPRKKRNKNKFKPDSEPAVASVAPQHGVTNFPSRNTLPMASERTMLANGRTPQESGKAAGRAKKKWKRKTKPKRNSDNAVPAPAQSLKAPGAEEPTLTPSIASQTAATGKHYRQGIRTAKKALDTLSQGAPGEPAQHEAHGAGANSMRQQDKQIAPVEQSHARGSGPLQSKPQRKRQKVHGREETSNGHLAASALQQDAPGKASDKDAPGAAAAAKMAVQTVTAPPLPGLQSSLLPVVGPLLHARHTRRGK